MTRILMITKMPPYPPNIGGNQRSNMIYRALARHGTVDLLLLQDPSALPQNHINHLRKEYSLVAMVGPRPRGAVGPWRMLRPLCPALVDKLAHHLGDRLVDFQRDPAVATEFERLDAPKPYDLLVGLELRVFFKTGFSHGRPHIVDLIDLDTDYYRSRLEGGGRGVIERAVLRRHLRQLEAIIPGLLQDTKHIWVANPTDLNHPGLGHARVLPNIPYVGPGRERIEALPPSASPIILFVGSFYHAPNVEGVERFLSGVWDAVVEGEPQAEFHIYGVGIGDRMRKRFLRHRGVKHLDPASDLADAYRRAAFTVAPIYSGAGTCFKVVESLAFGRAVILTPYAARGYNNVIRHMETAVVCASDQEMGRSCLQLLRDSQLRDRLATSGASAVAERYSFERFQSIVDGTLREVLG